MNLSSSPVDVCTALSAAFGISTALYARAATGTAQGVWACLSDLAVFFQSRELSRCECGEHDPRVEAAGHSIGVSAFERLYQCRDGWVALDCASEHVGSLLDEVGLSHLLPLRPDQMTIAGPVAREIERWMERRDRSEIYDRLLPKGVGVVPVMGYADLHADSFYELNRVFVEGVHPELGAVTVVSSFAEWERVAGSFGRPAPLLGQDTRQVLREFGLTEPEIDGYIQDGVVREGGLRQAR